MSGHLRKTGDITLRIIIIISGNTAIVKLAEVYKNDVCCTDIASEYRSFKLVYKDIFPVYNDGLKACEILAFLIANDMHDVFPNVSTLY